jgi:hypothetical protein
LAAAGSSVGDSRCDASINVRAHVVAVVTLLILVFISAERCGWKLQLQLTAVLMMRLLMQRCGSCPALRLQLRRQEEQQARKEEAKAGKAAAKAAKMFEAFATRKQNGSFCEYESVLAMDAATSRSALGMALATELDRRKTICWQVGRCCVINIVSQQHPIKVM